MLHAATFTAAIYSALILNPSLLFEQLALKYGMSLTEHQQELAGQEVGFDFIGFYCCKGETICNGWRSKLLEEAYLFRSQ